MDPTDYADDYLNVQPNRGNSSHVSPTLLPHPADATNYGAYLAANIASAFTTLVHRDDGWLRVIPAGDGKQAYAKWKFTLGKHAGCYVMVTCSEYDVLDILMMLVHQLDKVDAGRHKPTVDKYYDPS